MVNDSTAERARRLSEAIAARLRQQASDAANSRIGRAAADWSRTMRFFAQVSAGGMWLWQHVGKPVWRFVRRASMRFIFRPYRTLWFRVTVKDGRFSRVRGTGMIVATAGFVYVVPTVMEAFYAGLVYAATARVDERVVLLGSQQVSDTTGVHIVEGCERLPCSDLDSLYFRTDNELLFDNIWSILHGRGFFYTEYVGAAVPYAISDCVVTDYGWAPRGRLRFLRIFNTYAYVLSVTCRPV